MSKTIDFSQDWQLGWVPETKLVRWKQRFGDWAVEDGILKGQSPFMAQIFANIEPEQPYSWQGTVCIEAPDAMVAVMVCFYEERNTYYQIALKPGEAVCANYITADAFESKLLSTSSPVIKHSIEYSLKIDVQQDFVEVFLNNESLGTFSDERIAGRMAGFTVHNGKGYVKDVCMTDLASGDVLFEDDFSADSLKRVVPVAIEELNPEKWIPAVVPGTVHTSLLKAGIIEDPYYGYNGHKQKWIDNQRWIYKKEFIADENFDEANIELLFEGIDYHGYIWLNGELLGYHEGTQVECPFDITGKIRRGSKNEIVVCILPCPYPPHSNVKPYITQRWHFNMDILTAGLWRPVKLRTYGKATVRDIYVKTTSIEGDTAKIDVDFAINNNAMFPFELTCDISIISPEGMEIQKQKMTAGYFHGAQKQQVSFEIKNPQLWWPNNMGAQPLYTLEIALSCREGSWGNKAVSKDVKTVKFGIRTLEKRPTPDKQWKYDWIFAINGRPFFAKGANWMPIDQMLRLDKEHYESLLLRAKESNINMLRPWGAGLLETDEFYECCDRLGICVWQEFPLANGFFHKMNKDVWRETIVQNVKRLRSHPSLVLWCGGNEFDPDCPMNKPVVDMLENLCLELDPCRDFHRACPYGGDSHSYQVNWMDGANYTYFTRDISAAITEFSMASPPMLETLKRVVPEEEMQQFPPKGPDPLEDFSWQGWQSSFRQAESAFSAHDAHLSRAITVTMPFISESGIPSNWDEFISYTQNSQGLLTQFGIDFWRSRWPYCTAAMSWVFNVIWPSSFSWEYIDWFGIPKISYYYQKRAYEPLHVGAVFEELFWLPKSVFKAKIFVVNDTQKILPAMTVKIRLYSNSLELLSEDTRKIDSLPEYVTSCGFFEYRIAGTSKEQVMFFCVDLLDSSGNVLSRSQYCPRIGKPCKKMPYLSKGPWIADVKNYTTSLKVKPCDSCDRGTRTVEIQNTGNKPAYLVSLTVPDKQECMTYSDNYFWLEAGEKRAVKIRTSLQGKYNLEVQAWNAEAEKISIE